MADSSKNLHDQESDTEQERLTTIGEAARILGVSTRTYYRLAAWGKIQSPLKVGNSARVPVTELNAYIQKLKDQRDRNSHRPRQPANA